MASGCPLQGSTITRGVQRRSAFADRSHHRRSSSSNTRRTGAQDASVDLFDTERDPITVIRWREILEAATDRCEDVVNLLEGGLNKAQGSRLKAQGSRLEAQ